MEKGYIQIYTGNGKGKTTAAIGLAVRAAGAGKKVLFTQFLKTKNHSEHTALMHFATNIAVQCFGTGSFGRDAPDETHREATRKGFNYLSDVFDNCEFDVIIIETVGVGQSETTVASMVDFFMVLMIAGAGDELQGIKKGVLEVADTIVINKADGDNISRAEAAQKEYQAALHLLMPHSLNWNPPVLTCSSLRSTGLDTIWQTILDHKEKLTACGELEEKRKNQTQDWLTFLLNEGLRDWFFQLDEVKSTLPQLRNELAEGTLSPTAAATELLHLLRRH